jgi:hypothetical protein
VSDRRRLGVLDWLLLAALIVSSVGAIAGASAWWAARDEGRDAHQEYVTSATLVGEVKRLRTLPRVVGEGPPPGGHLGMLTDALGDAGLGNSVLQRVSPESESSWARPEDSAAPGRLQLRRAGARVELEGVSISQLGRFLASWRRLHPQWTPTTITLSPRLSGSRGGMEGGYQPPTWSVSLVLTCVYLAPDSAASAGGGGGEGLDGRAAAREPSVRMGGTRGT